MIVAADRNYQLGGRPRPGRSVVGCSAALSSWGCAEEGGRGWKCSVRTGDASARRAVRVGNLKMLKIQIDSVDLFNQFYGFINKT